MPATQTKQRVSFRNILFATDFSSAANSAMPYAAGLAKTFGAKLYALHVHEPANYALPPEMWQTLQTTRDMETQCLRDVVRRDFPGISPEILVGEGSVWPALQAAIETHHIDLIVIGTRGRTGIGKALLGSQAEEILRHALIPVLTVGPRALAEDIVQGRIAAILYATDFGPASLAAAPLAVSLAQEHQSKLTLLHVVENRTTHHLASAAEFGESSECQLRALVPDQANFWCAPHFIVEQGPAADRILEVSQRTNAGLIVMGVHRPEGMPGAATHLPMATVHKVVAYADCPVLTVRA